MSLLTGLGRRQANALHVLARHENYQDRTVLASLARRGLAVQIADGGFVLTADGHAAAAEYQQLIDDSIAAWRADIGLNHEEDA